MINWASRKTKRDQDNLVTQSILPLLNPQREYSMLSMPAGTWSYERSLAARTPGKNWVFTGIEQDPEVYEITRKAKPPGNAKFVPRNMSASTAAEILDLHDVVYLDYMGTWSDGIESDLRKLAYRKVVGQVLVLTNMLVRGHQKHKQLYTKYADETLVCSIDFMSVQMLDDARTRMVAIPRIVEGLFQEEGQNITFVSGFVYDSRSPCKKIRHVPEMVTTYKVN